MNKIQNETNKVIRDAKESYIKSLSKKLCNPMTGPKVFWSSYKRLMNNTKNTNIPPILENGSFISNFKQKASIFNNYFAKQCQLFENDSQLPNYVDPLTENTLGSINIREVDIEEIINKLNPNKAHGIDEISIRLLKICNHEISLPLKMIFKKAFEAEKYPSLWKKANVQPVHKKESRQIVSNYRPISLLCICGKNFEKLLFDEMYSFFETNSLITTNQSGFRPGDSTINQLLAITTEIC